MTTEPHGRTIVIAQKQPVTARPGRVRGYPVALQIGSAADLNLDLDTAVALYDALRVRLGEASTPIEGQPLFGPPAPLAPALAAEPAHPDGPAVPDLTPLDEWGAS
jgi:hypothetical protein